MKEMMKKTALIIVATLLISFVSNAQNNVKSTNQINSIIKTWYESPSESKNDIVVFKTTKHVNVPGVDVMGMEYSKLILNSDNSCELDFGKWCSNHQNHLKGTWSKPTPTTVVLDFGNEGCKSELKIISFSNDEVKFQIKEIK